MAITEVTWVDPAAKEEKIPKDFSEFLYDNESNGGVIAKFDEILTQIDAVEDDVDTMKATFKKLQGIYREFTDYNDTMNNYAQKLKERIENIKTEFTSIITSAYEAVNAHFEEDNTLMDDLQHLGDMLGMEPAAEHDRLGATFRSGSSEGSGE